MNIAYNSVHSVIMQKFVPFALISSFCYLLLRLSQDMLRGGNPWKQGDWLINSTAGLVRRSLTGDAVLITSAISDVSPVYLVGALQAMLLAALYFILLRLRHAVSDQLMFIIVCSPAFFPAFWMADPAGSFRKELIAFIALLLLIYSIYLSSRKLLWLSTAIFLIAIFSHEGLVTFAPVVIYIGFYCTRDIFSKLMRITFFATILLFSLSAALYSVIFLNGPGSDAVCKTLLAFELSSKICAGAITWLDYDTAYAINYINHRISVPMDIIKFLFLYAFCFTPIFLLLQHSSKKRNIILVFLLTGFFFLPLYILAIDWGRWINYHFFSLASVLMVYELTGRLAPVDEGKGKYSLWIGILAVFIATPSHTNVGIIWGGTISRIFKDFVRLLT